MSRTPRNEDIALMDVNPLDNRIPTTDQAVQSPPEANSTNSFFCRCGLPQVAILVLLIFLIGLIFVYLIYPARQPTSLPFSSSTSLPATDQSTHSHSEDDEWIEDEPYRHICIDYQWHEINYQCKKFYNSTPRCDLTADEDTLLLKELQACCEDDENCWPREMDKYCCHEKPCDHHKCRNPMPANGTSLVAGAILKIQLKHEEEREGEGIFSRKIFTQKQKKLIIKLHKVLNTKDFTLVREIMDDSTLIIYNDEVVRSPMKLTDFLDLSTVKENRIHFLIDGVEKLSQQEHAAVDFTGFMCTYLPLCSEFQVTFKWSPKRNDYFVSKFENKKTVVKPSIDDYPYWGGERHKSRRA
ncbi:unnamed protein product [Caenorhabditis auriculariae]|uniref:Uncharacterized protein n=1 Tax=Caenorhabditis auriculariae TaxID=2777116 RepID=A0A8S1HKR8_9PELO|nr:unnamed protein product [Caenorhabditis auriculariae]